MKKNIISFVCYLILLAISLPYASCSKNDAVRSDTTAIHTTSSEEITTAVQNDTACDTTVFSPIDETTAVSSPTPSEIFYNDNYAKGVIKDKVNDAVLALISCCEYYADRLKMGIKQGEKWVYSNSSTYVPQKGYFDDMISSKKFGANCASPVNWAFIDMGIMPESMRFYGGETGNFANYGSVYNYLKNTCTITEHSGKVEFKDLYNAGKVKAGDIFLCKHHTFIYRGDGTFYAAGHDGLWHTDNSAKTEDSRKAVFDGWICNMKSCTNYNYSIYYQIRLNDDVTVPYYRNSEGKLVSNPLYTVENSKIYNEADFYCYDTFGRDNVLSGHSFTMSGSFNIKKISNASNITDGQIYYDNSTGTYADCQMSNGNAYAISPTYWYDANGNKSDVKDGTHKYLCGFYASLGSVCRVDGFSYFGQNTGASSGAFIGDVDGFDILVSTDKTNWTVVYSAENLTAENKWICVTDEKNLSSAGVAMTHYIKESFDAIDASYIMVAITSPRSQNKVGAAKYGYDVLDSSAHYFRISEIQLYRAETDN